VTPDTSCFITNPKSSRKACPGNTKKHKDPNTKTTTTHQKKKNPQKKKKKKNNPPPRVILTRPREIRKKNHDGEKDIPSLRLLGMPRK